MTAPGGQRTGGFVADRQTHVLAGGVAALSAATGAPSPPYIPYSAARNPQGGTVVAVDAMPAPAARAGGFVADRTAHRQAERHIARTLPVYPDRPPITNQKGRQP